MGKRTTKRLTSIMLVGMIALGGAGAAQAASASGGAGSCNAGQKSNVTSKAASSIAWDYTILHTYKVGGTTFPRAFLGSDGEILKWRHTYTDYRAFEAWSVSAEAISNAYRGCNS